MRYSRRCAISLVSAALAFVCLMEGRAFLSQAAADRGDPSPLICQTQPEANSLLSSLTGFLAVNPLQTDDSIHYTLKPDAQFGTGGRVTTDFGSRYDDARAAALQPDGKMILAGKTESNDGSLCRIVSGGKFSTTCFRCNTGASSIPGTNFALARYQNNGDLDISFGTNGKVITDFGAEDEVSAVAIQSNGKIVVVGQTYTVAFFNGPRQNTKFVVARYNSDGSLDTTFGGTGKVFTEVNATSVIVQPDGKIVAAGYALNGQSSSFALARYNTDGSLDAGFGVGGKTITVLNGFGGVSALLLLLDNRIVAAGSAPGLNGSSAFALVRYNSDGSLDTTFGSNGKVVTSFLVNSGSYSILAAGAQAITRQPDGKILAGGYARTNINTNAGVGFVLARYNSDGSLDDSFGDNSGFVTTLRKEASKGIAAISLRQNGQILAVGGSLLALYNRDGRPDLTFGDGGSELVVDDKGEAKSLFILSNTKIAVVGRVAVPISGEFFTDQSCGDSQFMVARYDIVLAPPPTSPTPTPTPTPDPGPGPKPSPPPGCQFSYPKWLDIALGSDSSAIQFNSNAGDVSARISIDYPVPHLAKEGPIQIPQSVPFIGGPLGLTETYARLTGIASTKTGGGSLSLFGQSGFVAANQSLTVKASGTGTFSFNCRDGLALRRTTFNLNLSGSIPKEEGIADVIPPLRAWESIPIFGGPVKSFNDSAKIRVEISPSLDFNTTFAQDAGGNLRFNDSTATLGLDLTAMIKVTTIPRVKAKVWVAGRGGATLGVPDSPFVQSLRATLEAGAELEIDLIRTIRLKKSIAYGCTWKPDTGISCKRETASSGRGIRSSDIFTAAFRGNKESEKPFASLLPTMRFNHPRVELKEEQAVSVIEPNYSRFGDYSVFHASKREAMRAGYNASAAVAFPEQASTVVSNIFPGASPTITEAGGGKLLLWAQQDPALPVLQSTNIAWAFDNGSGWSAPSQIASDTQAELSPIAGVDARGKVVAAWLRIKDRNFSTPINAAEDLPLFYTRMEVVSAAFDPASRTWGQITRLTNDAAMDTDLRLSADGTGRLLLTWLSNPDAEFISSPTSPSTLKYSIWDGSRWSTPATIASGLVGVSSHAVAMHGDKAFLILPRGTGPDGTGIGVLDLYTWNGSNWSAPSTFAAGDVDNRLPSVVYDKSGEGHVVWVRGDDLVHATLSNPTPQVIRPGSTSLSFYDTKLLTNPQGNLTLLFPQVTSEGPANIFALIYDTSSGTWSADHRLHHDPSLAQDFSGYYGADGVLHLAYLVTEIRRVSRVVVLEGETQTIDNIPEEGRTDLRVLDHRLGSDLTVTDHDLGIIPRTPQTGSTDTATLDVHNSGDFAVSGFTVNLYRGDPDAGGVLLGTSSISAALRAGDHQVVLIPFTMPADISSKLVAMVITNNDVIEVTKTNNRAVFYFDRDTTLPLLSVPTSIMKEATSPAGAVVSYSASASDDRDPNPLVSCNPASGGMFALGTTSVLCTATDASGNNAQASFIVRVVDTTPPVLTVPDGITMNATSPAGAQVAYSALASDIADPAPRLTCGPASGNTFSIGTTMVTCTATDASGNRVTRSFSVAVRGAAEQLEDLIATVESFNRSKKPGKKFDQELNKALTTLRLGNVSKACQELDKFINAVRKESDKKLTVVEADQLLSAANRIRAVIACQ